ncbi:DNA polymerase/3'-5' exonuclease PolX [Patescibacteria group bacterium]|nr:DNA polymerase/3'-5' exonuclease PolX [Patescibacteria group bacterium]
MNINQELAKIFNSMANYLEMEDSSFRSKAYRKVAEVLETLQESVEDMKDLEKIPGVGKHIASKIEEYLKTGFIRDYEKLKKETPIKLEEIIAVEGMGVKKAKVLYDKLKIKNLKDLEKAAKKNKIAKLEGFGEKTEKNILEGIAFLERSSGRFLLGKITPVVEDILDKLSNLKEVEKISTAGSFRRRKETVGDVDILIVSKKPEEVMTFFVSLPDVVKVWGHGTTKSSVRIKEGVDVDLRVVPAKSYGSALQYFTGSKEHNIITRRIAIGKELKLNEYGVFRGAKMIAGKTEKEVYRAIGLDWIPPELRESELDFKKIPKIIELKDIKGDLHCHSKWNGGNDSIAVIAKKAMKMGYEYIGISDHTQFLKIEHGLNEKQLLKQKKEIDKINLKFKIENLKFRVLWGCEANILTDGSIDVSDKVLEQMDYVIAGVHSALKIDKEKMTQRIIMAMENPNVDIIAHPSGRILQQRDEYQFDFDKILETAKKTETILEINSSPARLDLKDSNIRKAKKAGVKMVIGTDAHQISQLDLMNFGVSQARRGWAEKEDIINTQPLSILLQSFK